MTRKGQISVTGTQWDESGEAQTTRITAAAEYHAGGEGFYILYEEANDGEGTIKNLIKFKNSTLELTKKGAVSTRMILAPGQEHRTLYNTLFGSLQLDIHTDTVESVLSEQELQISAAYSLCWQNNILCRNNILIKMQFEG